MTELIKDREQYLEELKALANSFLKENLDLKDNHKRTWESSVIENNIKQLKRIIRKVNHDLEKTALSSYVQSQQQQLKYFQDRNHVFARPDIQKSLKNIADGVLRFEVFTYSPRYSILYDLSWISEGTIGDQHDIISGKRSPDLYEKYCPSVIKKIKAEVIPALKSKQNYSVSLKILKEVVDGYKKNSFLLTNILLITITEGIVRELAKFVYKRQNPEMTDVEINSYIYEKHSSLETLIKKGNWKEDISMTVSEASSLTRYIDDQSLQKAIELLEKHNVAENKIKVSVTKMGDLMKDQTAENYSDSLRQQMNEHINEMKLIGQDLIKPDTDTINVSLKVKLQFLIRRYKEDRNSIIHGNYYEFDKGWKCFIYLSAIVKVFEVIELYETIYKE